VSNKFLALCLFPAWALAQLSSSSDAVTLTGEIHNARPGELDHLFIDLNPLLAQGAGDRVLADAQGRFHFDRITPGMYQLRVLSGPGADPILEQQVQINTFSGPLNVDLPERPEAAKPISGVVSLKQLQHAPSKKAVRAFHDAEQFSQAHDTAKAIQKLEQAIRLDPYFPEAHQNLGAQFARTGRYEEAMVEFHTALDIGPPDPKAYANLAFCSFRLKHYQEAQAFARKALQLDPSNAGGQAILRAFSKR
jgi:tetratricopeptide (TPR) repeat protein